jgi:hypothetical protein
LSRTIKNAVWLGATFCLPLSWLPSYAQLWPDHAPRDYEECAEMVKERRAPVAASASQLSQCNAKFAGRRKTGGGYVYFDFMQNRHFDIEGPNPSSNELKQMDQNYIGYLKRQRREKEAGSALEMERLAAPNGTIAKPAMPPFLPPPAKKPLRSAGKAVVDRKETVCVENSVSCHWSRLSAMLKALLIPPSGHSPKL